MECSFQSEYFSYLCTVRVSRTSKAMQTTAIGTVANSLLQNEVIILTLLISTRYIPYTDLRKKFACRHRDTKKGRNTVPIAKNAVSRPSTGLDRAAEAICEPFPNMNGRFSPHKSFSQVKTKITLFFKISYFRPYVYSFCHHFLTKKVNSAPFFHHFTRAKTVQQGYYS